MAGWGRGAQCTVVVWGRGSASTAAVTCALARCGSYCRIFFFNFYSTTLDGNGLTQPLPTPQHARTFPVLEKRVCLLPTFLYIA